VLASAAVQQLHAKHAISSRRIQVPPANAAAAAAAAAPGGVRMSVSVLSDAEQECSSTAQASSGNMLGQEDSWQVETAGESAQQRTHSVDV
jgi:hypothetical protein